MSTSPHQPHTSQSASTLQPKQTSTTHKMSWQQYVDEQLIATKVVKDAVIAGHDGNIWAASKDFSVSAEEMKKIAENFNNQEVLAMNGLVVAGTK